MTDERKKAEAIRRMKMLKLHDAVVEDFEVRGEVYLSEKIGFLYELDDAQRKRVEDFENAYDGLVYHVVRSYTNFGELLNFLYVSKHEDEWEYDRADLTQGYAIAYVVNLSDEFCSEFGAIKVCPHIGGLYRVF